MTLITFRVIDGADRGHEYADLPTPLTIGREEGNAIQLNDERVSRYHLKIQEDQEKVVLADLESTNGTKVNGESVQLWVLRPGDVISVGRSVLVFGSREEIARRLAALRGVDIAEGVTMPSEDLEDEDSSFSLDYELNLGDDPDALALLHSLLPPELPVSPESRSTGSTGRSAAIHSHAYPRIDRFCSIERQIRSGCSRRPAVAKPDRSARPPRRLSTHNRRAVLGRN